MFTEASTHKYKQNNEKKWLFIVCLSIPLYFVFFQLHKERKKESERKNIKVIA